MRLAAAWAGAMLLVTTIVLRTSEGGDMVMWRRVMVESSWLSKRIVLSRMNLSLTLCGSTCMRTDRCQLWCLDQPPQCLLSPIIVSGSYRPSQSGGALLCYTSRRLNFAVHASITSTGNVDRERVADNLLDGVYNGLQSQSAFAKVEGEKCWFLVDLSVERVISEVVLIAPHRNSSRISRFRNIIVKVGDVAGNFSSYIHLGSFRGPGYPHQEVVLRPSSPLTGRYVLILKTSLNNDLQIAHLEIR
ncbi:hypothetical protein E2C01_048227 [Portunus trituberculatus]|uniref:F5/8 type C domain-containing protein n=1 Tax=Portunus trituberculatus TaxID=210409 RepID=A0A5B7GAZ8_PORTR|nr:hypothetical protein [Portunus trituberculatus]